MVKMVEMVEMVYDDLHNMVWGVGALKIQNLNLGMLNHMNTPKFSLIKLKFRSKWTFPGGVGGGGGRIIWK